MISKFSVKKPYTVLVGVVLAIVLGVVSFTRMTMDLLPSISLPYVIVMTTYVGASPETVETTVTQPIESSMATISNIESISSISSENYSMVILEFSQTANMDSISLEIRESLDQLTAYWEDDMIGNPIIMKLNPDMLPVMIAAAGVEGMDIAEVSDYVEDTVVPELESVEGVASVSATGLIEESVNVVITQDKIDEVNERIRTAIDEQLMAAFTGASYEMPEGSYPEGGYEGDYMDPALLQAQQEAMQAAIEAQLEEAKQEAYAQADITGILTVDLVSALLTAQNFSMPAGYVAEKGISYLVRVGDKPADLEEMKTMPLLDLHMEGLGVITLEDVAEVFYVDNSDEVYANVNGSAGVMLMIQKQTGYSTGEVSDALAERFARMTEENPDLKMIALMDQGIYIDLVMDSIINNVVFGALLAILILILFLKDLRPTVVVAFSIPISLVTAIVCMYFSGVTLNVISLSGLALGIGMLVDNSIVVIENIYRMRSEGKSMREAAIDGAREVAGAIFASTLTTICVFLPIVFTEGITRQLFVDMGLTIAYSLLASLLIAMTVVPALASKVLAKTKEKKEGRLFGGFVKGYEKLLRLSLKIKPVVLILVVGLLFGSIAAAVQNGTAFMPDMDSTQLTVSVTLPEDATLSEMKAVADEVVDRILEIEDVENAGAMSSGSTMSALMGSSGSANAASIYVTTKEDKKHSSEELADLILEKTAGLDAEITVDTSSMDMSALGGSGITVRIEGRDLDTLQRVAGEVAGLIAEVEGIGEVSDGMEDAEEELRITVDKEAAVSYGLSVAQIFAQVAEQLAVDGSATTLAEEAKDFGVYVIDDMKVQLDRDLLQELLIEGTGADGQKVEIALSELATFEMVPSLTSIRRSNQTRYISVSASLADGYNIGIVASAVEEKLSDYKIPSGCKLVYAGENETINDAMEQVTLMLILALVFMYLIMVAQFQSLLSPFIIMFTIPLAFTGGFLGLFVTGSEVSVIAMIGFVMLSGVIVNNGIVLIDYMNQLRERGISKKEAIVQAGRTRLRPVLMTALTTILALSTMVFSADMGAEMVRPMAIVTIGGLLYGTILTLIVIPCIYDLFIREKKKREE